MASKPIDYLVDLIGDFVEEPKLMVIAGHPGSGKTTLASHICLYAMVNNNRCLYISFQEDREKLFEQLEKVGIDFKVYDEKGLLRFIKLPISLSEQAVQQLVDDVAKIVPDFNPKIIIFDSITPLFDIIKENVKIRGYLQNFFWELQKVIKGSIILISEVPVGVEFVGGVEFVADAVLILKHRVYRGLVERVMEIRKIRGRELIVAEIPFSIRSRTGLVFYPPIVLSEIKSIKKKRLLLHGKDLKLYEVETPSLVVYVEYPPDLTLSIPLLYVVLTHVVSNDKVLIIDYRYSEEQLRDFIEDSLKIYGADEDVVKYVLNKVVIKSINPTAFSPPEGIAEELSIIENVKPDVVVFHDVAIFAPLFNKNIENYVSILYNEILYLTQKGIDVTRLGSRINPTLSKINKMLADHVVDILCTNKNCDKHVVNVVARGRRYKMSWEELENHIKKLIEYAKRR